MLNFGASKPRVRGGPGPQGPPPGSAPVHSVPGSKFLIPRLEAINFVNISSFQKRVIIRKSFFKPWF